MNWGVHVQRKLQRMAHKRNPRRNKTQQRLITRQQPAEIIQFPVEVRADNWVRGMEEGERLDLEREIIKRQKSAEDTTKAAIAEIDKAERQFAGLFPDQQEGDAWAKDDNRIFMQKTMEHIQVVHGHLDGLSAQLNPMVVFHPKPRGIIKSREEFSRTKGREILVDNYFRDNDFKVDVLSRWRWNFLKHPAAFMWVEYDTDATLPDIRIRVLDRGSLYIDPQVTTGNIRHAAWIVIDDWMTEGEVEEMVAEGHWFLPAGLAGVHDYYAPPEDELTRRLIGRHAVDGRHKGADGDRMIQVQYYFQREMRGQGHAYGVLLGGKRLVRYGPNPYPYKGIPVRGKSYLPDVYRPDGISLARQYRSIQELFNTFTNLRIADVMEGIKRQVLTFRNLFDEDTADDMKRNQRFIGLNQAFGELMLQEGRSIDDFTKEIGSGESTQNLLRDLQMLTVEGDRELSTSDVFRGQNPQSGATLGQVQEQLFRSQGVFRPIHSQELQLVVEIAAIVNEYFSDPDFFGEERLVAILGRNRYSEAVQGISTDGETGQVTFGATYDEMDVDVSMDAVSQAEHLASRTLRMSAWNQFLESSQNHPELRAEVSKVINMAEAQRRHFEDTGMDVEGLTFTPQQQQQRAQEKEQAEDKALQKQMQILKLTEQVKESARTEREVKVLQVEGGMDMRRDAAAQENKLEEIIAKVSAETASALRQANAEHLAEMETMLADHRQKEARMLLEQTLEVAAAKEGIKTSIQSGGNDVST